MNCPYCQSDVHPDAVVCKTCQRDFYLVKPLMEKIAALESKIAEAPDVSAQVARIAELEQQLAQANASPPLPAQSAGTVLADVAAYLVVPLLLLLAAHAASPCRSPQARRPPLHEVPIEGREGNGKAER